MTINQFISIIQYSELNQLPLKEDREAITAYINLGLLELYKRFPLKISELIINLDSDETYYSMPSDFMWIVSAHREVNTESGCEVIEIPINEENNPLSINTFSWNTVQVPMAVTGSDLSIIYTASPKLLTYNTSTEVFINSDGIEVTDLEIPLQLVEALTHYVAYRAYSAISGASETENNAHYQRFEVSCQEVEKYGMLSSDDLDMKERNMKGFV